MAQISSVPFKSLFAVGVGLASRVSEDWRRWLQEVKDAIDATARRVGSAVALAGQVAAVSGTLYTPARAGLFRVSWVLLITQAATTSSSLQLSIGATTGGVLTTQTGQALTSNTFGDVQSGSVVVSSDAAAAITYAVAYASVGGTPLAYAVNVTVEALP